MIRVNICGFVQKYDSSLQTWVKEQYNKRKNDGADFWFIITIETGDIQVCLASETAPGGRGKPYKCFNSKEKQIIDLWEKMNIKEDCYIDSLLKFLKVIEKGIS